MGESIVEAPRNVENKMRDMRESVDSGDTLEVSVSFGRFENDSLSWEKWSSFSPNKYLEEVEKCSTPGSVAQKKAYFEAHYKRIAAQKAAEELEEEEKQMETNRVMKDSHNGEHHEQLALEKQIETNPAMKEDQNGEDLEQLEPEKQIETNCLTKDDQNGEDHEQLELGKKIETNRLTEDDQNGEDHDGNTSLTNTELRIAENGQRSAVVEQIIDPIGIVYSSHSDESNEDAAITIECQSSLVDRAKEEIDSVPESNELNRSEEPVLVQEETHLNGFEGKVDLPPVSVQEETRLNGTQDKVEVKLPINSKKGTGNTLGNKKENEKLDASNKPQKMAPTKKEKTLVGSKKKPASPIPKKSPQISTPKASKQASTSNGMTGSWSSTKKANGSSLPRSKNLYAGESKKVAPSLHMSLSLGPANSDSPSFTIPRKSFIMEKMGDKDIVKRAFKTFQNNFNQARASGDEKYSGQKEVSTTRPEQKLSASLTPRKENEGLRKPAERMDAQRAQLGRSWNTASVGSLKGVGMDQRTAKPAPSFGLRSGERVDKRKDFVKKLEEKSYAKEAEKARHSSKSKWTQEEKEAEMKKLRQSLNFKATPMPGFYRAHTISKSSLDKELAKNKHHHRTEMHR